MISDKDLDDFVTYLAGYTLKFNSVIMLANKQISLLRDALNELKNRRESVTPNKYQNLAMRTNIKDNDLCTVGLGLCGESGEVADLIKKHVYQGHAFDKEKLEEELGDVCWYIALGCEVLGISFEDVLKSNIKKLKKRYPHGFSTNDSINRVDEVSK